MKMIRVGVNFDGIKISEYQNRKKSNNPPDKYIEDSFEIFAKNDINCVRIPFYWESYEKDPDGFMNELGEISKEADTHNIMCIYDNHQWECSSYLGWGIGFPKSLMSTLFQTENPVGNPLEHPRKSNLEMFWNQWWDRKVVDLEDNDGWDLQKEFLKKIIIGLADRYSTVGFEILNEPQVFRGSDYKKISEYNDFMIKALDEYTQKPLFFSYAYSNNIQSIGLPWRQAKINPSVKTKNPLIFDVHPYPPYIVVLLYYKLLSMLMQNSMIFAGEYNAGVGENITINSKQHSGYVKKFIDFSYYGAAFWWWSFKIDSSHPAFNLTNIAENRIIPNENFENLVKSLRSYIKKE